MLLFPPFEDAQYVFEKPFRIYSLQQGENWIKKNVEMTFLSNGIYLDLLHR